MAERSFLAPPPAQQNVVPEGSLPRPPWSEQPGDGCVGNAHPGPPPQPRHYAKYHRLPPQESVQSHPSPGRLHPSPHIYCGDCRWWSRSREGFSAWVSGGPSSMPVDAQDSLHHHPTAVQTVIEVLPWVHLMVYNFMSWGGVDTAKSPVIKGGMVSPAKSVRRVTGVNSPSSTISGKMKFLNTWASCTHPHHPMLILVKYPQWCTAAWSITKKNWIQKIMD